MRHRAACTFVALAALALSPTAHAAQPVSAIPVDKCVPDTVLVAAYTNAVNRVAEFSPRIESSLTEVQAILDRYPGHAHDQQAVMNFLSPKDNVRMTELLATSAQLNMYSFVEQRAERDANVMIEMFVLAQNARDGKTDLMARALATMQADEAGKPRSGGAEEASVVYLVLLRHLFKDSADPPQPTSTSVCSVDLALAIEDGRAFKSLGAFIEHDPEVAELLRLRDKYHVPEGQPLAVDRMPASEAKYATELQTSVQGKAQRLKDYHVDLLDLRRLAAINQVRYESQREDLVKVGGARDKEALAEMDAMDQARFKTLSSDMQKLWNLWDRIDKEVPTMMTQMMASKPPDH